MSRSRPVRSVKWTSTRASRDGSRSSARPGGSAMLPSTRTTPSAAACCWKAPGHELRIRVRQLLGMFVMLFFEQRHVEHVRRMAVVGVAEAVSELDGQQAFRLANLIADGGLTLGDHAAHLEGQDGGQLSV